jgi:hypothetical protein
MEHGNSGSWIDLCQTNIYLSYLFEMALRSGCLIAAPESTVYSLS